jgi:hypothetical protein
MLDFRLAPSNDITLINETGIKYTQSPKLLSSLTPFFSSKDTQPMDRAEAFDIILSTALI